MVQRIKFHLLRSIVILCAVTLAMAVVWVLLNPYNMDDPVRYITTTGMSNWFNNLIHNLLNCYFISVLLRLDCSKGTH